LATASCLLRVLANIF